MMTETSRPPVNWIRLLGLFTVAGFIETVFYGHLNAFTPLYLPQLGIDGNNVRVWTGALASISTAVGLPFLPLWGALADRHARQPVIVRTFVAYLVAVAVMLLSGSVWGFAIGRSVMGLALGSSGLMMTTLSERTPRERLGLAFSILNVAPPLGAFVGPLVSGPVVDKWGFPTLLLIDGILVLLMVMALTFGYKDSFRGTGRGSLMGMAVESVLLIWRSVRLRALFLALFLLFAGWMLAFSYAPLAITALYQGDDPATAVGIVLGAGGLTALVLSPLMGAMSDRFGHWRVLFAGAGAAALLWPLPWLAPDLVSFGVTCALVNGVVSAIFAISFTVLSASAKSERRGRVMSFAYVPVNLGFMLGPAVGSAITGSTVFTVFPTAAVLTTVGIGVLWIAWRQPVEDE
jgi:DHA1 family multidrug resistance protein-like MFS transporter